MFMEKAEWLIHGLIQAKLDIGVLIWGHLISAPTKNLS